MINGSPLIVCYVALKKMTLKPQLCDFYGFWLFNQAHTGTYWLLVKKNTVLTSWKGAFFQLAFLCELFPNDLEATIVWFYIGPQDPPSGYGLLGQIVIKFANNFLHSWCHKLINKIRALQQGVQYPNIQISKSYYHDLPQRQWKSVMVLMEIFG